MGYQIGNLGRAARAATTNQTQSKNFRASILVFSTPRYFVLIGIDTAQVAFRGPLKPQGRFEQRNEIRAISHFFAAWPQFTVTTVSY